MSKFLKMLVFMLTQHNPQASTGLYTVAGGIFIGLGYYHNETFAVYWGMGMILFFWIMNLAMYFKEGK